MKGYVTGFVGGLLPMPFLPAHPILYEATTLVVVVGVLVFLTMVSNNRSA
jgi:hypothetical protein